MGNDVSRELGGGWGQGWGWVSTRYKYKSDAKHAVENLTIYKKRSHYFQPSAKSFVYEPQKVEISITGIQSWEKLHFLWKN